MTITMQVEKMTTCLDDIKPLFHDHWLEIAGNKDTIPLDPDFDRYQILEDQEMLRIFTVRDEGKLVGYFISFIAPNLHYKTTIYALNDVLYVDPDYRAGTVAYRMFNGAMKDLKDNCNVDMLVIHMKVKFEFRKLLKSLGFTRVEENWERLL